MLKTYLKYILYCYAFFCLIFFACFLIINCLYMILCSPQYLFDISIYIFSYYLKDLFGIINLSPVMLFSFSILLLFFSFRKLIIKTQVTFYSFIVHRSFFPSFMYIKVYFGFFLSDSNSSYIVLFLIRLLHLSFPKFHFPLHIFLLNYREFHSSFWI